MLLVLYWLTKGEIGCWCCLYLATLKTFKGVTECNITGVLAGGWIQ